MQIRVSPKIVDKYSTAEWQARIDLAAAHRLAYMHGFSEGIFNHLTFVVPSRDDRYYPIYRPRARPARRRTPGQMHRRQDRAVHGQSRRHYGR
jgi:ribulose-5-phosphate 4-epimerase/fuculose-1-phosphate aldolase